MSAAEIRAKVLEAVRFMTQGSGEPIGDDTKLEIDLELDHMERIELVMEVELRLRINIDDDKLDEIKTVGDLVKAAQEAVEKQAGEEEK